MKRSVIHGILSGLVLAFAILTGPTQGQEPAPEAAPAETPAPMPETAVAEAEETPAPALRGRNRRGVRPGRPGPVVSEAESDGAAKAEDTLLGGSVPALWEIESPAGWMEEEEFPPILQRDTVAPSVPAKVVRYAVWLMERYDANGDGLLEEEEWKKMPGAPQAIDMDGDGKISLEELVRFLGLYGRNRTIHKPNPVEVYHQPRMVSSEFRFFKPVSAPPPKPAAVQEAARTDESDKPTGAADLSVDLSEDILEQDAAPVDEETYAEVIAARQTPAARKYYTPPESLRGVPAWFLLRDRDGDGQVSLIEFAPTLSTSALALFGKLDKNGDGFITADEIRGTVPPEPPPTPSGE